MSNPRRAQAQEQPLDRNKPLPPTPLALPKLQRTRFPITTVVYNRRNVDSPYRRFWATLLLVWAPSPSNLPWNHKPESVLAYAPIHRDSGAWHDSRGRAAQQILENAPDLSTMLSLALVNKYLSSAFQTVTLQQLQGRVLQESPILWELCERRSVLHPGDLEDPREAKNRYIRQYLHVKHVVGRIRRRLFEPGSAVTEVETALGRIWTFHVLFGAGSNREIVAKRQQAWLAGEQCEQTVPSPIANGNGCPLDVTDLRVMLTTRKILRNYLASEICQAIPMFDLSDAKEWASAIVSEGLDAVEDFLKTNPSRWRQPLVPRVRYTFQYACKLRLEKVKVDNGIIGSS